MKKALRYSQHRHDRVLGMGEHSDPCGKAETALDDLLERKGFFFQLGSDYYCYGRDEQWLDKQIETRPLICIYESGTWDGKPVEGYPMRADVELVDYLNSLPDFGMGVAS